MNEFPDYGRDFVEINRAIRRLAPTCGVDLNNFNSVSTLLDGTNLPIRTVQDKARITLRGLMFLRLKVWNELRA